MLLKQFLTPVQKYIRVQKQLDVNVHQLFRIITDVDRYSQFVPYCTHSQVLRRRHEPLPQQQKEDSNLDDDDLLDSDGNRNKQQQQQQHFEATLTVGMPLVASETYVSSVVADRGTMTITSTSIESQRMDSLRSRWILQDLSDSAVYTADKCHVDLQVELVVRDPVIVTVLDQFMEQVSHQQVEAFRRRCYQELEAESRQRH